MNRHIAEFFRELSEENPTGNFHRVTVVDEASSLTWNEAVGLVPSMPKGWFELAKLDPADKLEFIRDYWLSKLPYEPECHECIPEFFERLDDIHIVITEKRDDEPYEAQMVYSLRDNGGFFCGQTPASDDVINTLQNAFPELIFPPDYLAFLAIHNGFCKFCDTGLIKLEQMKESYLLFQEFLGQQPPIELPGRGLLDPKALMPFYESFGLHCYQCFCSEWYPEHEMGNVYYSGIEKTLSDPKSPGSSSETLAFPTFLDWLVFYLEGIG